MSVVENSYKILRRITRRLPILKSARRSPLHRNEEYRPFFIFGSGRCGTTLLRRLLIGHPGIHIPPETYVLGRVVELYTLAPGFQWDAIVDLILATFEYHPEFETFGISLRPLAARLKTLPPEERSLARILDGFYRFHADDQGRSPDRWGDKTPLNTFHLSSIKRVFPKGQFIHLLRDGCDCVASMLEMNRDYTIESASQRWNDSVTEAQQFIHDNPDCSLEVRYEDLVADPESTLRQVCEFLGFDYLPEMLRTENMAMRMGDVPARNHHCNVGRPINTNSVGKGRRSLNSEDRKRIDRLIGRTLVEVGYDHCSEGFG